MSERQDFEGCGREELAILVREYLLAGHMIDRAGMPQVIGSYGPDAMREVAIDEWMGASPIYTRRMQHLLGYEGDSVETMFKGIQFDIGSPPQYMDFRFKVDGPTAGEFWLDSCGALMDVEPMGDDFVVAMCHHIEDPTFDATACAVNPRARVRPIHRPPRLPADRHPHCHWTVVIDPANEAVAEPAPAVRIGASLGASSAVATPAARTPEDDADLLDDYRGPLVDDVRLEDFRRGVLVAIADEVCLQGHLLAMAFAAAVDERFGVDAAVELGRKQFIGVAGLTADRLRRALGLGQDLGAIATVLELHPAFRPRSYVDALVEQASNAGADVVRFSVGSCPARQEPREHPWPTLLQADDVAALDAIVQAVNPTARCTAIEAGDERLTFEVTLGHEPAKEAPEVLLTRFSTGAEFVFQDRPRRRG